MYCFQYIADQIKQCKTHPKFEVISWKSLPILTEILNLKNLMKSKILKFFKILFLNKNKIAKPRDRKMAPHGPILFLRLGSSEDSHGPILFLTKIRWIAMSPKT